MPRKKKATPRGGGRNRGGGHLHNGRNSELEIDFVPFAGTDPGRPSQPPKHHGFTLQSEALNTQRHHSWGADQRLRNAKVPFVSAGDLKTSKPEEPESALADMSLEDPLSTEQDSGEISTVPVLEDHDMLSGAEDETAKNFMIDIKGSQPVITGLPAPYIRSRSPTPSGSDSSDEIIMFAGRDRTGKGIRRTIPVKRHHTNSYDVKIKVVEDKIQERKELLAERMEKGDNSSQPEYHIALGATSTSAPTKVAMTTPVSRLQSPDQASAGPGVHADTDLKVGQMSQFTVSKREHEQSLIDDYIANMEDDDMGDSGLYNQRELGGDESSVWRETDTSSAEPSGNRGENWDRSEIHDFDDLSTSDGFIGSVQEVLSKRERKSGLQYLVVWEGQTVDEARWVLHTSLLDPATIMLIKEFEVEEKLVAEMMDDDDDDSCEDSDDSGIDEDTDEGHDEIDLIQRKIDRMTDEKIARLLAKQEEIGMGSHELMLFDDSAEEDGRDKATTRQTSRRLKRLERATKRPRGEFPAASTLADAYDGFDVMDFERPSLKKKPKGRRAKLAFDHSDSDLEASMRMAWDNDRQKKKERKQEREELRSQGLLGKMGSKPDLKAKYKEGMGIHAVKDEIKSFLVGGDTTLSLPPMDKADRKVVHELANAFNLKSKSAGKSNKRFPILYRTSRTLSYTESAFVAVEARLTRRYLPRMDVSGKRTTKPPQRSGKGGFGSTAVSYRDGDVVGASAPELGIDNKGRAMLEKMGWSTGTALGALNNKGILQPVSHVVKTTKAGLG